MMASDQQVYGEQESSNGEQNLIFIKNEENDRCPENTEIPLANGHTPVTIKSEEDVKDLGDNMSMDEKDMEAFDVPGHFLSETNSDGNGGMDVKCGKGDSSETLYTLSHTYGHTGRKRMKYSCKVCKKDFKDKTHCIRHIRVHTGEKPFKCNQCGKCFGSDSGLASHMQTHTGEKPFSCSICNKNFTIKGSLEQHLLLHTDMSERPHPCNQCGKAFGKRSQLKTHLKYHTQTREYICNTCGKGFTENRYLLDHTKRVHSDRVLPSCEKCNREFKWDHLLRQHIKSNICNSYKASEDLFLNSAPIFVSKEKQAIQAANLIFIKNEEINQSPDNPEIPLDNDQVPSIIKSDEDDQIREQASSNDDKNLIFIKNEEIDQG